MSPQNAKERSLIEETFVQWGTGLAFGLMVAFVVVSFADTRPMLMLKTWGSDLGMRVFAEPSLAPDKDYLRTATPFVFLDLGRPACRAFVGDARADAECNDPAHPPLDLLTSILDAVSAGDPKIIVLDFPLPAAGNYMSDTERSNFERFYESITLVRDRPLIPVIAPAPLRPGPKVADTILKTSERFMDTYALGRLRLASFMNWSNDRY